MPIWVAEYAGWVNDAGGPIAAGSVPAIKITQLSSGSSAAASTMTFQAGTVQFTIGGDVASYMTVGSSTAGVQSSSLALRIPANVAPVPFGRQAKANNTTLYAYST